MAITNETTPHLGLPLPHPSNSLEDDVLRLRAAINAVDAQFLALDTLLASNDAGLNTIQEIVDVLKDNVGIVFDHVGAGGDAHDDATVSVSGFMSAGDKTKLDGVTLVAPFTELAVTPTAGQTVFTVAGGYVVGCLQVFVNGVKLVKGDDFAATDTTSFTLTVAVGIADTVEYIVYKRALAA